MPSLRHTVEHNIPAGLRLDRYVAENLKLLSRSQIKARELAAAINGKDVKISRIVKSGDLIELNWNEAKPVNIIPENIPLAILYEDRHTVVLNKPQGMVVHPGAGNRRGTLANALYYRKLTLSTASIKVDTSAACISSVDAAAEGLRPGIVHRLDKETSGVIIAAYDEAALAVLADQFKSRQVKKTYLAIVKGVPKEKKGIIKTYIARDPGNRKRFAVANRGKVSLTYYSLIKLWRGYSLLALRPKTGRTHQIRVHLRYLGHPIIGDPLYGHDDPLFPNASLMLHSRSLAIVLPGETEKRVFKSPLPERFREMIRILGTRDWGLGIRE
jgi:23S rRNA pseudouridine1911/1915/1917 synthase